MLSSRHIAGARHRLRDALRTVSRAERAGGRRGLGINGVVRAAGRPAHTRRSHGRTAVSVCIDPTSANAASMAGAVQNTIATWNALSPTGPNLVSGGANNIPAGQYDFESVMLHELGHCIGLSHTNAATESGLPSADQDYTKATDGANNAFNLNAGTDGIKGSADDMRGDDLILNWFVDADNDPCTTTLPATIDASTMSRTTGSLPAGDNYSANADRTVCGRPRERQHRSGDEPRHVPRRSAARCERRRRAHAATRHERL